MKKASTILISIIFFFNFSIGQDTSLIMVRIPIMNVISVQYDHFNKLYVTTEDYRLIQFNDAGIQQAQYNEIKYGNLSIVDLSNPLAILLYYPDFGVIQILDRNLSLQSEINLRSIGFQTNTAVGLAADNNIWFYNLEKLKLFKIDPTGKVIRKSNELIGLIGKSMIKGQIREQDNFLLARAPGFGWMLFDDFGSYIQGLPIPDEEIQYFSNDKIIYREDEYIKQFELNKVQTRSFPFPSFMNVKNDIQFINDTWIEKTPSQINIYKLKN
jgi:hypothetical protein